MEILRKALNSYDFTINKIEDGIIMQDNFNIHMNAVLREYNKIYKQFNDIYRDIAAQIGVSNSVFDIMYTICELGNGCQQKDICETTLIPKQTVNSSIRILEKEGFLRLESGKGRGMKIYLTPLGEEKIERLMRPVIDIETQAFEALGEEQAQAMLELNSRHNAALREAFDRVFEK